MYSFVLKLCQVVFLICLMLYCYKNTRQIDDDFKILTELHNCIVFILIFSLFITICCILLYLDINNDQLNLISIGIKPQYILTLLALFVALWSFSMIVILCLWPLRKVSYASIKLKRAQKINITRKKRTRSRASLSNNNQRKNEQIIQQTEPTFVNAHDKNSNNNTSKNVLTKQNQKHVYALLPTTTKTTTKTTT